jgi:hypothetical protein
MNMEESESWKRVFNWAPLKDFLPHFGYVDCLFTQIKEYNVVSNPCGFMSLVMLFYPSPLFYQFCTQVMSYLSHLGVINMAL